MTARKKVTTEVIHEWNTLLHSILKNYVPFIVYLFTKDISISIASKLIFSNYTVKNIFKKMDDKTSE